MNKKKQEKKQKLVEAIIEELKRDPTNTALWGNIESLLYFSVGTVRLETFLPMEQEQLEGVIEELKCGATNTALWGNIESLLYYRAGIGRLKTFLPKKQGYDTEIEEEQDA